jgi:hypothetical protein
MFAGGAILKSATNEEPIVSIVNINYGLDKVIN